MTRILLSLIFAVFTPPPQSFGQDYINFYDDVHPRPRWEDMPQSMDASAANFTREFWDKFSLLLQNRTTTRDETIARSLGESLGDSSYYFNDYSSLPGSVNARNRFMFDLFGSEKERKVDPYWENSRFAKQIENSVLGSGYLRDSAAKGHNFPRFYGFNSTGCNPENPRACSDPGYVRCLSSKDAYGSTVYRCGCDFQHTEVPYQKGKPQCVKNVFTQCTMGQTKYKCGENMDCVPDTLHLEEESFCRCKEGFAPAKNSRGIPAFCRPIIKEGIEEEEQEDFGAEEAHAALILIRHSLLLLSLIATAAIT